ncbi:Transcriptional regulator, TetR family [Desulfosarcina cetonica]|uniref:TetR/AcrR family transcriptional regulator n=1 Tax=Desulfosarcina cetonica TaxID=90730 RepID=UPI0006CF8F01|nr:TetR/AcrR family transcriptional regulator [Desulfosarcina cetonica]VTR64953.1 Transcriptional regulator, TetR family [Desulfosarcina cetonica]
MGIQERRERERERRRQQILVAAKRVFSDKGFSKATMDDIAREAELSPGTLYLYFKNKDELYASLSLRILQYLMIRLEHVKVDPPTDAAQRLSALKDAMYDVYEFDPLILINMFHMQSSETLKNLSPDLLNQIETLSRGALQMMAKIFEDGTRQRVFVDHHPTAVADTLWSLFSGVILWETSKKTLNNQKNFLKETFDTAFEIFSRGIMRH